MKFCIRHPLLKDIVKIILSYREEPLIKGEFDFKIGKYGNGLCEFNGPRTIRTDGKYIYVCDCGNERIQRIDVKDKNKESKIFESTQINVNLHEFAEPYDIAVNEPYIYVTSLDIGIVHMFEISTGNFIRDIYCEEGTCNLNIYIHNSLLYTCAGPDLISVYTLEGNFVKNIEPKNMSIFGSDVNCHNLFGSDVNCHNLFVTDDDIYICCGENSEINTIVVCITIEGDYKFHLNGDHFLSVNVTEDSVYIAGWRQIVQYDRSGKFIRKIESNQFLFANGIEFIGIDQCFITDLHNNNICVFK